MHIDDTPIENMTLAQIEAASRQLEVVRKMKTPSQARQMINAAEYKRFEPVINEFFARQIDANGEVTKSCAAGQHKAEPYGDGMLRCKICGRIKVL